MRPEPPAIQSGQEILHYRLAEKLGEGGMGQVWKALDLTLDRAVAIKVLPPAFSADPERLARFEREARLLASLNHPSIATVFSVHVVDEIRYLIMEYVPGEDLAQRIERGPMPTPETVEIALQIANALDAAHENAVVHRDLKPANVRITPEGRVKVLDFGLAKALDASPSGPTLSQSPTFAVPSMASGMIVGTAGYMSPEQARGQKVDRRADIWAFGVVLYEMLTGKRAYTGETVSDVLAAVLRDEVERSALPKDLPPALRTLLDRCLEKNPRRRLRDIGEAIIVLEDVQAGRTPTAAPALAPRPASRSRWPWVAAAAGATALAVVAMLALRPSPDHEPTRKYTLALKDNVDEVVAPIVSPGGRQIAYLENHRLWVRDLGQLTSRQLAEGLDEDFPPLWSPDGSFIVFATNTGLSRVDVAGGAIAPLCSANDFTGGSGGTWTEDGQLLFARGHDHIYKVAGGGGVPSVFVARIDSVEADLHQPFMLPRDRGILCVRHMSAGGPNILALIEKGKRHDLLKLESGLIWDPIYDPRGYVIFTRIGDGAGLWALPFSLDRMAATGEAFLIAPDGGSPSVAADGDLVYRLGGASVESRVVVVDRSGAIRDTLTDLRRGVWSIALSPDGNQLAVEIRDSGDGDIWLYSLDRNAQTRFASGPDRQSEPMWSTDGKMIAYRDGTRGVFAKQADGSQAPRLLARGFGLAYTPDGQHVVYGKAGTDGGPDIWYSSVGGADSVPLVQSRAAEGFAMPAPQGGYLLYVSDESGSAEIYLRQFPTGEGRWQVSTNGGSKGLWSRKGDRIYYWDADEINEVTVELSPSVRLGTPRVLFNLTDLKAQTFGRVTMVPTADPDRFLMIKTNERASRSHVDAIVVENWVAEFGKRR